MLHDFSQSEAVIRGEFLAMLSAWQSPSVLYRAKIFPFPDGDAWCCLYGENIQDGVCAFGATPAEAARNFDWYVWHGKPVPEANLDAERETVKGLEARQGGFDGQDEVLDIKKSDYYALRDELSQLQALVRARDAAYEKILLSRERLERELRGYPPVDNEGIPMVWQEPIGWVKRTLDATTPDSNQLGDINDMVSKGGDGE